jgi:hypothetical protein
VVLWRYTFVQASGKRDTPANDAYPSKNVHISSSASIAYRGAQLLAGPQMP